MSNQIGIDIVEFEEIKERLTDRFVNRILSEQELLKYNQIRNSDRKISYLAGRFAAKEAYTISKYRPEDKLILSISHSRNYAIAICMKE